MNRIVSLLMLAAALSFTSCATNGPMKDTPMVNMDHCAVGMKQTANVSFSSATTTSLIAPVTGATVYICGYDFQMAQNATTAQTFTLEYGTGATCGTGTTTLGNWVGNITASTPAPVTMSKADSGYTQMATTTTTGPAELASQRICGVTTQSSVVDGYITYVQE